VTIKVPANSQPAHLVPPGQVVYVVRKKRFWPWFVLFLILIIVLISMLASKESEDSNGYLKRIHESYLYGTGEDKVALIKVEGIIEGSFKEPGRTGTDPVREFSYALKKAREDDAVKALVISVNSPGGGITASDIMYHKLLDFKQSDKPVVALLGDLAASGGYYVIAPADRIIAHPTSITGSIGVIMLNFNIEGLMAKLGVNDVTIKAGKHKDLLSPFRQITPEERDSIQKIVDLMLDRFIGIIAESRKMDKAKVRDLADGSVYYAGQAVELGLVDQIGYLEDAVVLARDLAGLDDSQVVEYGPPPTILSLLGIEYPGNPWGVDSFFQLMSRQTSPRFMYLWNP